MFMNRKSFALILSLFIVFLTLAFSEQVKAEEKTLTIAWGNDIGNLNPHNYLGEMFAQGMLFDPLVVYGPKGKILPGLAESWSVSADGREYRFNLRRDVKFSDGSVFDAHAAALNFKAVLKNIDLHSWMGIADQIEGVEAADDHTLILKLKNPFYPTLQELSLIRPFRFLSPKAFPENGDTSQDVTAFIGTGPWVLEEYRKSEYAVFTQNKHYWGEKPKLNKIVIKVIPDSESRVMALETGTVDLIFGQGWSGGQVNLDTLLHMKESGKFDTAISEPMATRLIGMHSKNEILSDKKVRLAIEHGLNKALLVKAVFRGAEHMAGSMFARNMPYCDLELTPYQYDPEMSKTLMDEAGWRLEAGEVYRQKDGQRLSLELLFVNSDPLQKSIAEVFQADMKDIGVEIVLAGVDEANYITRLEKEGDFDLTYYDTWGAPYDPHSLLAGMRVNIIADYHIQSGLPDKKVLDEKVTAALASVDEKKRQELLGNVLRTLHAEAVYIPISYLSNISLNNKRVTGVSFGSTMYEIPFHLMDVE